MYFSYFALLPLALASPAKPRQAEVNYEGYEAFTVNIANSTAETFEALKSIDYDQWALVNGDHIDIALAPEEIVKFKNLGLDWSTKLKDIAGAIKQEKWSRWSGRKRLDGLPHDSWFDSYHSYDEHVKFWRDLQRAMPLHSEWVSTGTSLEGRDMFGLKLGSRSPFRRKKAVIWHGQGMTLEYIAWQMIFEYKRLSRDVRKFLDEYDFYIFPFVNPDGFVYSQTTERLWRKNRQAPPTGSTCFGVDLNRNWPNQWDTNPGGSSPNPCSQSYRGIAPGSEPEMKGLTAYVNQIAQRQGIKLYIDWHSFGNYILSPWGYTCSASPANNDRLVWLGRATGDVISRVNGQVFTTGPTCQTLYAVNGGSLDYVYDVSRAELSYAWELRDRGEFGFLLPPNQIRPTGEENWRGMLYMLKNM
ncbi:Putative peptidase M14, carboxypeptidase A [Septoria linicola]|uniref:Peptidase M14, carboxypeptidase A n=1 Tax=Septoria linicola TaxID=215465 RepID=A0A9Q9EHD7_9PEZI|nr:putative peptidase M14, carboxypeptidase A [Septoria linicola]USW49802.1 Putative peptidase M14, carboxypeptidase A [Septoria linicola]